MLLHFWVVNILYIYIYTHIGEQKKHINKKARSNIPLQNHTSATPHKYTTCNYNNMKQIIVRV